MHVAVASVRGFRRAGWKYIKDFALAEERIRKIRRKSSRTNIIRTAGMTVKRLSRGIKAEPNVCDAAIATRSQNINKERTKQSFGDRPV